METVPSTAPATILAALRSLKQATPHQVLKWYETTYERDFPLNEAALRQAARRMTQDCRVISIGEEHGLYRLPTPEERQAYLDSRATGKKDGEAASQSSLPEHPVERPDFSPSAYREQMGREADEYDAAHPPAQGLAEIGRHASYTVLNPDGSVQFRVSYLIEATPGVEVAAFGGVS